MNWELFAAFLLITVVLVVTPGPIVTLVIATGASRGIRAALITVAGTTRETPCCLAHCPWLELGFAQCRGGVRDAALGRRGLPDLARHSGLAPCRSRRRYRAAGRARAFLARIHRRDVQPEDHRLLHRVPAAVHRRDPPGRAAAGRYVRRVGGRRRSYRRRLGRCGRAEPRLVLDPSHNRFWAGCPAWLWSAAASGCR